MPYVKISKEQLDTRIDTGGRVMELHPDKHYIFKVKDEEQCLRLFDAIDNTPYWSTSRNSIRTDVINCIAMDVVLDTDGTVCHSPTADSRRYGEVLDTEEFINHFSKEDNTDMKEQIITQEQFDNIKKGALLKCDEAGNKWFVEGTTYPVLRKDGDRLVVEDIAGDEWSIYLVDGKLYDSRADDERDYTFSLISDGPIPSTQEHRKVLVERLRVAVDEYNNILTDLKKYGMVCKYYPLEKGLSVEYTPPSEEY